jgi:hypothetical protein
MRWPPPTLTYLSLLTLLLVACVQPPQPAPAASGKPASAAEAKPAAPAARPADSKPAPALPAATQAAPKPPLAAEYFAGKTVTLLVNFSAGGATDIFARLLAPYLPRHIPRNPTVIVQNMGGAGGAIGLKHLYSVARPDGLTIGTVTSPFTDQVLRPSALEVDATRFMWLGGVDETSVGFFHQALGITRPTELPQARTEIVVGGLSPENSKDLNQRAFLDTIGAKHRYVTGYPGNNEGRAAFEKLEINFFQESLATWMTAVSEMVNAGSAFPAGQVGISRGGQVVRDPRVDDVPTYFEVAVDLKGEAVKQTIAYRGLLAVVQMGAPHRGILLPPGTPQPVVDVLRKAVADTFADPDFQAAVMKQSGYQFVFTPGAQSQDIAQQVIKNASDDKEAIDYLRKLASSN